MPTPEQEALEDRRKHTVWLLAGAGASLILPLLGLFYLRSSESGSAHPPTSAVMFDRREPGESKISAYKTVSAVKPTSAAAPVKENSSLSFVKGSAEYFKDQETATNQTPEQKIAAPAPAPSKAPAKGGKKSFSAPKLQGVKTFSTFKKGASQPTGGREDILKNLPPGAENNPEVQKYLKGRKTPPSNSDSSL